MTSTEAQIPTTLRIDGQVESASDLIVDGRCDGVITVAGTLTIAEGGICSARVRANRCILAGEVRGQVTCTESIEIRATATVVGDLRAPDISVDPKAHVEGRIDLLPPEPEEIAELTQPATWRGKARRRPRPPALASSPASEP